MKYQNELTNASIPSQRSAAKFMYILSVLESAYINTYSLNLHKYIVYKLLKNIPIITLRIGEF